MWVFLCLFAGVMCVCFPDACFREWSLKNRVNSTGSVGRSRIGRVIAEISLKLASPSVVCSRAVQGQAIRSLEVRKRRKRNESPRTAAVDVWLASRFFHVSFLVSVRFRLRLFPVLWVVVPPSSILVI